MKKYLFYLTALVIPLFAYDGIAESESAYKSLSSLSFPYNIVSFYVPWASDRDFLEVRHLWAKSCHITPDRGDIDEPARYLQYILARNALAVQGGDFIECGVQDGLSLFIFASVLDLWDSQNRSIYGFDSFLGLAEPTEKDLDTTTGKQIFRAGSLKGSTREQVETISLGYECHSEIIQGWIPYCFQGYEDKRFCFAHIDVDLHDATREALAFVYPRMLKGGIILLDDYGFPMCAGAKKAIDDFFSDKPEVLITELIGRAYIIKQ